MKRVVCLIPLFLLLSLLIRADAYAERQRIQAIGIPLADHYSGIVAYEKYRQQMQYADYQIKLLPGPELVRSYFNSEPDADIAFLVAPMVMDMFAENPNFRWVSLIHRDGTALAINDLLNRYVDLPFDRTERLPDEKIAQAIRVFKKEFGRPVEIAIPSFLATHTTILYKYLKDQKMTFGYNRSDDVDVVLQRVKPPQSPLFLRKKSSRAQSAAFVQSLPWAEVVESNGFGVVGWYSKDVMHHEKGHVECIVIAKDKSIREKQQALQEVIKYIHLAGHDIESARRNGGKEMDEIIQMVRKHIPAHSKEAIIQSLRAEFNVINYNNLNVDDNAKSSFREIMNLAFEAGFIKQKIDINALVDDNFSTHIIIRKGL